MMKENKTETDHRHTKEGSEMSGFLNYLRENSQDFVDCVVKDFTQAMDRLYEEEKAEAESNASKDAKD